MKATSYVIPCLDLLRGELGKYGITAGAGH